MCTTCQYIHCFVRSQKCTRIFHLNIIYLFTFVIVRSSALWMVWNKILCIIWTRLSPQSDNRVFEIALVTICFAAISALAQTHSAVTVCAVRVSILGRQMESWEIAVQNTFYTFFYFLLSVRKLYILLPRQERTNKKKMFRSKLIFNKNCLSSFMLYCLKLSTIYLICKK